MSRTLIALAGFSRSGKDTLCAALPSFTRAAFADALKADIDPLFPDDTPKEIKRPVYVAYGATWRAIDGDYWLKRIVLPDGDVCITDVRYANEARWIQKKKGLVFRIHRPGVGPANDEEARSFAELDKLKLPQVQNDGTIQHAVDQILAILGSGSFRFGRFKVSKKARVTEWDVPVARDELDEE